MRVPGAAEPIANIQHRAYAGDCDFWQIRKFLVETYPITPLGLNWEVRRWDGAMFYKHAPGIPEDVAANIHLWYGAEGELLGVVCPEGAGEVHLFIHPDYRHLEQDLFEWAEDHLAAQGEDDTHRVVAFAYEYDVRRSTSLRQRGYRPTGTIGLIRRLRLKEKGPSVGYLPEGYSMATTRQGDLAVGGAIADLLNTAFGRDFHIPEEHATFSRFAPSYLEELDLIVITGEGDLAAYVGVAYDDSNRLGIFEPVCTHPDHRQMRLARSLMLEGILRLDAHGAREVVVSTGDMEPANKLYDSLGFNEKEIGQYWEKKLSR